MTKRVFIHRGAQREEHRKCVTCPCCARLKGQENILTCCDEKSDHYQHVFLINHPACDRYGNREGA